MIVEKMSAHVTQGEIADFLPGSISTAILVQYGVVISSMIFVFVSTMQNTGMKAHGEDYLKYVQSSTRIVVKMPSSAEL